LVQTPVGARCSDCAGLKRIPVYEITPIQYLKALGVGLGSAIVFGIIWGWFSGFILFFNFFLAAAIGYAIGEVISLSVNRKRGAGLQTLGGLCVALSYIVSNIELSGGTLIYFAEFGFLDILAVAVGIFVVVGRLR